MCLVIDVPLMFLLCVSTAAGVLLFADVWTCTDASQIPMTDLDKWLQHGPSSIERIASLEEIGLPPFVSLAEIASTQTDYLSVYAL